jgi:hypothetical protein
VGFMGWIGQDERARRTVLRRAQSWASSTGKAPKTAQSVITELG